MEDENFQKWNRVLMKEPEQIIRYNRGNDKQILLPVSSDSICLDPGKCDRCGCTRTFEFQTTPHLMLKTGLEVSGGDLASVVVFTCPRDCVTLNENESFVTEKAVIVCYQK